MTMTDEPDLDLSRRRLLAAAASAAPRQRCRCSPQRLRLQPAPASTFAMVTASNGASPVSGTCTCGRRAASAVRADCVLRGRRLMAHAAAGAAPPGRARASRRHIRAHHHRRDGSVHGRKGRPDCLRIPRENGRGCAQTRLSVCRLARRRSTGIRHLSDGAARPVPNHVHKALATREHRRLARSTCRRRAWHWQTHRSSTTTSARPRLATPRSAWNGWGLCSISSTATFATPTWPKTACERGGTSGTTTHAAPVIGRGCPSPGNHENELGNGPIGYQAYQTYFSVPEATGQTELTRGLWYAFTAWIRPGRQHRK